MSNLHYVIIGCGAAGSRAAFQIREMDSSCSITVVSQEAYHVYHKYDLTKYLCGQIKKDSLFHDYTEKFIRHKIHLRLSQRVISIDIPQQVICLAHKEKIHYDKLLISTGVKGCIHPTYEKFTEYLTHINDLRDIEKLLARSEILNKPLILGGSLTGIRLAVTLRWMGKPVDYLIFKKMTGNLLAGANDFDHIRKLLLSKNVNLIENIQVTDIQKIGDHYKVIFSDLSHRMYSIIFSAFGVKPNIGLARGAGIPCELGILVNEFLETKKAGIYASGDVAQIYNPTIRDYWVNFGWSNAVQQGTIVAKNMCGYQTPYDPTEVNIFEIDGAKIKFRDWQ